ncbi:MAG: hypothetical protein INF91_05830 [Alphaproteobacteria bacterium]|nr:hypothetical protein [Alphaproteobacteria bacterium]
MNRARIATAAVAIVAFAPAAAAASLQDAVNAAQAAYDAGRFAEAASGFSDVIARIDTRSAGNRRAAAILRGKLGAAQARSGRLADAATELQAALKGLPAPEDAAERAVIALDLGQVQESLIDFDASRATYERALADLGANGPPADVLQARLGIARVTVFKAPDVARRMLDIAIPDAERLYAGQSQVRDSIGAVYSLRGRIELNHGNPLGARDWFDRAARKAGGTQSTRVTLADTRIRSDLSLAHFLAGNEDEARRLLAFSGAGNFPDGAFAVGADTPLPPCGPASGLAPADMAIIEFSISDRGTVLAATPIYSTRPGIVEDEFLRYVRSWSWSPEALARINPFWRAAVRLEMRCSGTGAQIDSLWDSFGPLQRSWYLNSGVAPVLVGGSDAAALPQLRAELTRREAASGAGSIQLLPVLDALIANSVVSPVERAGLTRRRSEILLTSTAPGDLRGAAMLATLPAHVPMDVAAAREAQRRFAMEVLPRMISTLERRGDAPRALAWAMLDRARRLELLGDPGDEPGYRAVLAFPEDKLPAADPIRQTAQLRIASILASRGDVAAASSMVQATGLSPDQCALVDLQPARIGGGKVSSRDFPAEAMRWRFDGWAKIGYDVAVDGRPINVRTVLAYPPFVFGPGSERVVSKFRFEPVYRPGATVGCVDRQQSIRFLIPGRDPTARTSSN